MENKAEITKLLEATINATRIGKVELTYLVSENGDEMVTIEDEHGHTAYADVTADSGCALIRAVINSRFFR